MSLTLYFNFGAGNNLIKSGVRDNDDLKTYHVNIAIRYQHACVASHILIRLSEGASGGKSTAIYSTAATGYNSNFYMSPYEICCMELFTAAAYEALNIRDVGMRHYHIFRICEALFVSNMIYRYVFKTQIAIQFQIFLYIVIYCKGNRYEADRLLI